MTGADDRARDALARRLEAHYRTDLPRLVRRALYWCGGRRAEAEDAVQEAFARVYAAYVDTAGAPPPDAAAIPALVGVTLRRVLVDLQRRRLGRRAGEAAGTGERQDAGDDGEQDAERSDRAADGAGAVGGRQRQLREAVAEDPVLEQSDDAPGPEEAAAAKQVLSRLLDRLAPRDVQVLRLHWAGASPVEIGTAFGRNGYTLRRVARERAAAVLAELAAAGDTLAAGILEDLRRAA
jgi:RNA polymerase sigma factor (sigma-70 family)